SLRITSTSRGSFWISAPMLRALCDGCTVARSTKRSSALDTTFCATTRTSPATGCSPARSSAVAMSAARSSPGFTSGKSGTPITSMRVGSVIAFVGWVERPRSDRKPIDGFCSAQPILQSSELGAQAGQHVFGIEAQEALLVAAGRVEHEVAEALLHVGPHPLYLLVRVGRDDPTGRGLLGGERLGQTLHLDRVLDVHFLLGRERERRPFPRVVHGALHVGVVRHLHLDHFVDRVVAAGGRLAD